MGFLSGIFGVFICDIWSIWGHVLGYFLGVFKVFSGDILIILGVFFGPQGCMNDVMYRYLFRIFIWGVFGVFGVFNWGFFCLCVCIYLEYLGCFLRHFWGYLGYFGGRFSPPGLHEQRDVGYLFGIFGVFNWGGGGCYLFEVFGGNIWVIFGVFLSPPGLHEQRDVRDPPGRLLRDGRGGRRGRAHLEWAQRSPHAHDQHAHHRPRDPRDTVGLGVSIRSGGFLVRFWGVSMAFLGGAGETLGSSRWAWGALGGSGEVPEGFFGALGGILGGPNKI